MLYLQDFSTDGDLDEMNYQVNHHHEINYQMSHHHEMNCQMNHHYEMNYQMIHHFEMNYQMNHHHVLHTLHPTTSGLGALELRVGPGSWHKLDAAYFLGRTIMFHTHYTLRSWST